MKERPILFYGPMVRAILEGRKTMTRRIITDQSIISLREDGTPGKVQPRCPYGKPGDRLWVRETFGYGNHYRGEHLDAVYRADKAWNDSGEHPPAAFCSDWGPDDPKTGFKCADDRWRPSIHMPRWASRIDLEITGIRVERLHDISEEDAELEGMDIFEDGMGYSLRKQNGERGGWNREAKGVFIDLWESINGVGSWDLNPLVWVVEFRRVKP